MKRRKIEDVKLSDTEVEFPEREEVHDPGRPKIKRNVRQWIGWKYRKFKKLNLTKKILIALAGVGSSYFFGVNVAPLLELITPNPTDMELINDLLGQFDLSTPEMIVYTVIVLLATAGTWVLTRFDKTKYLDAIKELKQAVETLQKARSVAGPDGAKINEEEMRNLISEALDAIEEVLELFGIDYDLNKDGL